MKLSVLCLEELKGADGALRAAGSDNEVKGFQREEERALEVIEDVWRSRRSPADAIKSSRP